MTALICAAIALLGMAVATFAQSRPARRRAVPVRAQGSGLRRVPGPGRHTIR